MLNETVATGLAVLFCAIALALYRRPLHLAAFLIAFRAAFQLAAFKGYAFAGVVPWFTPVALCTLAVGLWASYARSDSAKPPMPIYWYIAFTVVAIVMELGNFEDWNDLIELVVFLTLPIVVYFCAFNGVKRDDDIDRALTYFVAAGAVPALAGVYQYLIAGGGYNLLIDDYAPDFRITGSIIDPNLYSIFLCMVLFAVIALVVRGNRSYWILGMGALLAGLIILAQNRGSWIAMAAAVAIAVAVFHRRLNMARWMAAALVVAVVATPVIIPRFENLNHNDEYGQSQDTFSERLVFQSVLLEESAEQPFTGLGYRGAEEYLRQSIGVGVLPHNDYVRTISESGYIAFALYFCFLFSIVFSLKSPRKVDSWKMKFVLVGFGSYVLIISLGQNLLYDMLVYPMVMYLVAVLQKSFIIRPRVAVRRQARQWPARLKGRLKRFGKKDEAHADA